MRHLKQPIAWRANREEDCRGHFFEQCFFSGPNPAEPLRPLASGIADDGEPVPRLGISFGDYTNRADTLLAEHLEGLHGDRIAKPDSP